jgi:HAD superfamily hydrolase (TIGR01549 family)
MIKGILFDYGGTIDTNGLHWGGVLWDHYQKYEIPVSREAFSKAYSFGERALAIHPLVKPEHDFYDVLNLKTAQQFEFLTQAGCSIDFSLSKRIAEDCNQFARSTVEAAIPVLEDLAQNYPLVMVSNFYGNLNTVLSTFGITRFFTHIVESAVVGVRKPNPEIYQLGVNALGIPAEQCVVIGDSYSKDVIPGHTIGCKTIWLNVHGWEEPAASAEEKPSLADSEIKDFAAIKVHLEKWNAVSK